VAVRQAAGFRQGDRTAVGPERVRACLAAPSWNVPVQIQEVQNDSSDKAALPWRVSPSSPCQGIGWRTLYFLLWFR